MTGSYNNGMPFVSPSEREALLKEAASLDQVAENARQAADLQRLVACLERALHVRRRLFPEKSGEVAMACQRLCEACNAAATGMLQKDNLKGAHELLKRAEQVAETSSEVDKAVTWNNFACYYRRVGKIRAAVSYLERALQVEEKTGSADCAQTHLNLCATLSQLQRHDSAIYHAQCALIRVYEMLSPAMMSGELGGQDASQPNEAITVLCIAYHNIAVEHEHVRNYESAMAGFVEGLRWAYRFLPGNHQLTNILKSSILAVKAKLPDDSAALRRSVELLKGLKNGSPAEHAFQQAAPASLGPAEEGLLTPRQLGDGHAESQRDPPYVADHFPSPVGSAQA